MPRYSSVISFHSISSDSLPQTYVPVMLTIAGIVAIYATIPAMVTVAMTT
ncbi:Uncharacterised protein [Arcanobacterium haemolyticum]|uniref:Uncharacterized protein n=1 Tax=Arcanobacterium haemolyticum (strain ATCC 9345 / DSM 20595 / CCM 5947 / CCUG 17215 / LMG 16163 / NBRC 15585 / NCTC 8452 / 11018) TaxID=644284 RepID=D7BNF4_ARCHD|nr:hypothetical protein Arch_0720 [Arcanobacterium haemolyticum DSM 20595]SPT75198.1 Uncharacterised protein [Arcanobacterium haemolyticum]SQH28818.1 Uncharacterised protein [Arcanobacterium haemolyticum]